MKLTLTLLTLSCLSSCFIKRQIESLNLVDDPNMGSVQANYPSAEFEACGGKWLGLGYCYFDQGDSLSNLNLKIKGFFDGTIRVSSIDCDVDDILRYTNSEMVSYPINREAEDTCVVSMLVSPEYPGYKKAGVVTHSLKGHLLIKVGNGRWQGHSTKTPIDGFSEWRIPASVYRRGVIVFAGCGIDGWEKSFENTSGFFKVLLDEVYMPKIKTCVLHGGILHEGTWLKDLSWIVAGYDQHFVKLTKPKLRLHKGKLHVNADETVSMISLNDVIVMNDKAKFDFDMSENATLRILTTKGRLVVGFYNAEKKFWDWRL